ncbi:MAG: cyclopropane-fatty-acyl-phospholipid synthase family protein [Salinibacter sp.]
MFLLLVAAMGLPIVGRGQVPDSTSDSALEYRYRTEDDEASVPYATTPRPLVDSMLSMAEVGPEDVVYDLGSGDGRIPIRAARKYGARGVGIEINPELVDTARAHAKAAGVADRVAFRRADFFEADIEDATVVTLYLLPSVNLKLRSKLLRDLRPGTRVVSRDFHMAEWTPEETKEVGGTLVYLWRVPEEEPAFVEPNR